MKTAYRKWIGERIRHYRKKKNLTQLQIAHDLDLLEPTYRAYEQGLAEPSIYTLQRLCRIFNIRVDTFLQGSPGQ